YLANSIEGDDSIRERRDLLYDKGPLVLHALRQEVGDATFFQILRTTLGSFTLKPIWTRDFIATTNLVTKRDFRPWFDRYVFGADRKMRIEVGYGLEAALPDLRAHRITSEVMRPFFQRGDLSGGVEAGAEAILAAARGEPFTGTGRTVAEGKGSGLPVGFLLF